MALLFVATVAVLGLSSFRDWRELAVPGLQAGTLRVTNVSMVAILGRLGVAMPGPCERRCRWLALWRRGSRSEDAPTGCALACAASRP